MTVVRGSPVGQHARDIGSRSRLSTARPRSPPCASAVAAIGITLLFIGLTCWWLSQNRAMPYGDAGFHLATALEFHDFIAAGHWTAPFTWTYEVYPPLTPVLGALGLFVGGRTPSAPVLAQNLLYVPLLALASYRIAKRTYGSLAGCLAVTFALGTPLIAEQFHVFMLDAPLTALVAGTVWLVLESERFARVPFAAAAGVVVGLGLLSKQTFPLYVAGLIVLVLARHGGWRNVRGLCAFLAAALLVAAPWYVAHAANLPEVLSDAGNNLNIPALARPPLLSTANLSWYPWALVNSVLLTPLLALASIGVVRTGIAAVRSRTGRGATVELLGGLLLAFAAITAMPHKDVRYAMPLLVFIAVLGTGWIAQMRPRLRTVGIAALATAAVASTLGATFGIGPSHSGLLPGNWYAPRGQGVMPLDRFTIYTNHNYMVSGPRHAGDLLGLFDELHDAGVREVWVSASETAPEDIDFNHNGLLLFARMANLTYPPRTSSREAFGPAVATLIHALSLGRAPACVRLPDGTGIWMRRGNPWAPGARDFCPRFARRYYGP
jgi:Dolichyl-phosphate-mannose-protein mannosyltransferase